MAKWEMRTMPVELLRPAAYNPRVALRPGDPEYDAEKMFANASSIKDWRAVWTLLEREQEIVRRLGGGAMQ